MEDGPVTYDTILRLAEEHFAFLLSRGFRIVPEGSSDRPVLMIVMIAARKVGILLTYDRRDRVIDLDVASIADNPAQPHCWNLDAYLRTFCGYRGGYSDGMTVGQLKALSPRVRLARDMRWYAGIIQKHAPCIVDDTEDFVRPALTD
jgi:hypothetical protein